MARGEITGRKTGTTDPRKEPTPRFALSIPEFCEAHGISEGMYYKMKKQDRSLVPREMNVGTRTLITFEAAADWRADASRHCRGQGQPAHAACSTDGIRSAGAARAKAKPGRCGASRSSSLRDQRYPRPVDRLTSPPKITAQRG